MLVFLPRHSVATWQFVDLCLYRHATLPIGFPLWISRLVVGYFKEHEPNLLLRRYLLCSRMGALSENQIAVKLYKLPDTIKFCKHKLFDKLKVVDIAEALSYAVTYNLF